MHSILYFIVLNFPSSGDGNPYNLVSFPFGTLPSVTGPEDGA